MGEKHTLMAVLKSQANAVYTKERHTAQGLPSDLAVQVQDLEKL